MNRRVFLPTTTAGFFTAPAVMSRVLQDTAVPVMPGGVQVSDVTTTRVMIWSAADRTRGGVGAPRASPSPSTTRSRTRS